MNIKPPHQVMAWLGPIALINAFVWILVATPETRSALCAGSENCLTDWIGALSGWAAFVAALITIAVMHKQMERQQRQIDFQIGDANPTAYAISDPGPSFIPSVVVFIKNWNRRPIEIDRLLSPKSFDIQITKVILDGRETKINSSGRPRGLRGLIGETLPGRSDDGKAPVAEIHIEAYRATRYKSDDDDYGDGWDIFPINLRLECTKIDSVNERFVLDVTTKLFTC